ATGDVGLRHDAAAAPIAVPHGGAAHLALLHHPATVFEAHLWRDRIDRTGHAVRDPGGERMLSFRDRSTGDVAIRDGADEALAPLIFHDRQRAAIVLSHHPRRLLQVHLRRATGRVVGHNLLNSHGFASFLKGAKPDPKGPDPNGLTAGSLERISAGRLE